MINIAESRYGVDELLVADAEADERRWLPFGDSAFSLPLLFDVRGGSWVSLFKAKGAGTIERHRHSNPVTGWTLEGTWGYRERDWIARRGTFIFEPAGDIHTLYVHPEAGHMKALFHVFGPWSISTRTATPKGMTMCSSGSIGMRHTVSPSGSATNSSVRSSDRGK